jgi:hypothetical protein
VCRFARDFAKVADQVRFLTRILTDGGYGVVALHATYQRVVVGVPALDQFAAGGAGIVALQSTL